MHDRASGDVDYAWEDDADFANPWSTSGGAAATTDELNALSTIDDSWFRTDVAGDEAYNYHLFNITVDNNPSNIQAMTFYWAGKGEGFKQVDEMETQAWVWNDNSKAWETMQDRDDVVATSGFVMRITSGFTNYINSSNGNSVFIKVRARHDETCAQGCPYIFGWNGDEYKFIDIAITSSFMPRYEAQSLDTTSVLEPKDGYYDLMAAGVFPHEEHINSLGLWAVDHPDDTRVIADGMGGVHTIGDLQPVTAVDSYGRDVTSELAHPDKLGVWESDLTAKDFGDIDQMYDWIEITLPDRPDEGTAKLVVDAVSTDISDMKLDMFLHYMLGSPNIDYVLDRIQNNEEDAQWFDYNCWLTAALRVQSWNGGEWADLEGNPGIMDLANSFGRPQVVPIDLSQIQGDTIRLLTPAGAHRIDYIAVDYTPDEPVTVTVLEPAQATLYSQSDLDITVTRDVLDEIGAADDAYACFGQEDYINYRFEALGEPAEGMTRSFVVPVGGYYYREGPVEPEDKMEQNLEDWEYVLYTPHAIGQLMLPVYADHSAAPDFWAFHNSTVVTLPEFEVNWDSLDSDYVGVWVAEETTCFVEQPHSPLKPGDWWLWNVSYGIDPFEDVDENCYDYSYRNWEYIIRVVNQSGVSTTVYTSSGAGTHTVSNCTQLDSVMDENNAGTGRGSHRAVFTGNDLAIQAANNMNDAAYWVSPLDATLNYHLLTLTYPDATNGNCLTDNYYTYNSDTSSHDAVKYGYPYALGDSTNVHEYYYARPDLGGDQHIQRDWNVRVVNYQHNYDVGSTSNQMFDTAGYDHDGNTSNAVYDVWVSDQYQTSNSYAGGKLTPEGGSRIHYYSPAVKNDVRLLDAYQYIGAEEWIIQAYEVGPFEASDLAVTWSATTSWSVNITNTDCENGRWFNALGWIVDTNATGDDGDEPYPNGRTVWPNMHSPDSGSWPFFTEAIKHVYLNASETKTLNWNTSYSTTADNNFAVWCQGEYAHK